MEKKQQIVKERIAVLRTRSDKDRDNLLGLANENLDEINQKIAWVSIFGPIIISLIYSFFPVDFSSLIWWKVALNILSTIIVIALLLVLFREKEIRQKVVGEIEKSKENSQKQIERLEKNIRFLKDNQIFFVSTAELIANSIKEGKNDIKSLSKILVASIYHNLSQIANGDNITINLYELKNDKIRMIFSNTRFQYCDRNNINAPFLLNNNNQLDISDSSIQEYYCIKCMRNKIRSKNHCYRIYDWKDLAKEFKWDGWTPKERDNIINNNDREKCIEIGFKYNQYFAFDIRRNDNITCFFEIITNEYTTIASDKEFDHITYELKETYLPFINILWDLSSPDTEKENSYEH